MIGKNSVKEFYKTTFFKPRTRNSFDREKFTKKYKIYFFLVLYEGLSFIHREHPALKGKIRFREAVVSKVRMNDGMDREVCVICQLATNTKQNDRTASG